MDCEQAREAISASLDEPVPQRRAVTEHVADCPACQHWQEHAVRLTRLARLGSAGEGIDVTDRVLASVRLPRFRRWMAGLRVALVLVAVGQLAVGLGGLLAPHGSPLVLVHGHANHEVVAFNLAIGAALLWAALPRATVTGPLPALSVFVLALIALTSADMAVGHIGWDRIGTHIPAVVGLGLVVALAMLRAHAERPDGYDGTSIAAGAGAAAHGGTDGGRALLGRGLQRPAPGTSLPPSAQGPHREGDHGQGDHWQEARWQGAHRDIA